MDQALDKVEIEILDAEDMITLRRCRAWKLRLMGYGIEHIAEELRVSHGTAQADVRWALDHLPSAYESAEDFRRITLKQLDDQFRRLTQEREIIDNETGRVIKLPPTETAERVALANKDLQAKLLGAYAPSKVDGSVVVKYSLAGVDVDDV